jgi:hypothetical protein
MPESIVGYAGCVLDPRLVGGFGAGRLATRLWWPFGTGGGARGFSKLPSWATLGNLGLAGGLIIGDMAP